MLAGIARVYTGVTGTVVSTITTAASTVPHAAASTTTALWSWWEDRSVGVPAAARSVTTKAGIASAAVGRIATAVTSHATGKQVAQLSTDGGAKGRAAAASPRRRTSPCTRWTILCARRPSSQKRGSTLAVQHSTGSGEAPDAGAMSSNIVTTALVAYASRQFRFATLCRRLWQPTSSSPPSAHRHDSRAQRRHHEYQKHAQQYQEDTAARLCRQWRVGGVPRPVGTPRFAVYLKKRPLHGTEWAGALTKLGQDHVGVVLAPYEEVSTCGGRLPLSLPNAPQLAHKQVAFDFGPVCGKDFSIFRITDAEIRRDKFEDGESAIVAASSRTWEEVEAFNRAYQHKYHLGVTDCRDYAAALVHFMTGVAIHPANVATYIATVTASSASHAAPHDDHHDVASPRRRSLFAIPSMHSVVAGAPRIVGLGL